MDWSREKVIIYGGGGFLGRYIVEKLISLNCRSIRIFNRRGAPDLEQRGVEVIRGDIRDRMDVCQAAKDCTTVFHTAAKAGIWGSRKSYYAINVTGTENVLAACRSHSIPTLVYTSSPSVAYPPTRDIENIDENEPYPQQYLAYYPETKAIAEKKVLGEPNKELAAAALRPHLIWGPGDPHLLPRVIASAKRGRLAIIGNGENKVDMTYAANAALAHVLAAEYLKKQEKCLRKVYFVSDNQPIIMWEWLNDLLKRLSLPPITRTISLQKAIAVAGIIEFVYKVLPLGEPPITRFAAGQMAYSHYFNISAAINDLGYAPKVTPEAALEKTVEWLKHSGIA